ncbi:MAG: hypothetical protein E7378_00965 [Clostridiales bacterium]|nr:hypothetical protein [Clostridiales bacterium]
MVKKRAKGNFILSAILLTLALVLCFVQFKMPGSNNNYTGLFGAISATGEVVDGNCAVYEITDDNVTSEKVEKTVGQIRSILNKQGFVGSKVYSQGEYIKVETQSTTNATELLDILGNSETFYISSESKTDGNATAEDLGEYLITEDQIKDAYSTKYVQLNEEKHVVVILFNEEGAKNLEKMHELEKTTIYLYANGAQRSSLNIADIQDFSSIGFEITAGSNQNAQAAAQNYAFQVLMASTGVNLKVVSNGTSTATLGSNVLLYALIALAIVLAALLVIFPVMYGPLGLAADLSILVGVVANIFFLQALPFTTGSIATVFGSLLGIGIMAVCHFIYLNKVKSEFKYLHRLQLSAKTAFKKSWLAILDICAVAFFGALAFAFWNIPYISTFAIGLAIGSFIAMFNSIVLLKAYTKWYFFINTADYRKLKFVKGENNEN